MVKASLKGIKFNGKAYNLLKQKINIFLIGYFNYLALSLALIIVVVSSWLFIYPRYRQISQDNKAARQTLAASYKEKADLLKTVLNLKESYNSISAQNREKIIKMAPDDADVGGLIKQIELIALKSGVILNSLKIELPGAKSQPVSPGQPDGKAEPPAGTYDQPPAGVKLVKMEVNLSAVSYPVLKNVLKTFENNIRLLDVAKIDYGVNENKATLTVYAYYINNVN